MTSLAAPWSQHFHHPPYALGCCPLNWAWMTVQWGARLPSSDVFLSLILPTTAVAIPLSKASSFPPSLLLLSNMTLTRHPVFARSDLRTKTRNLTLTFYFVLSFGPLLPPGDLLLTADSVIWLLIYPSLCCVISRFSLWAGREKTEPWDTPLPSRCLLNWPWSKFFGSNCPTNGRQHTLLSPWGSRNTPGQVSCWNPETPVPAVVDLFNNLITLTTKETRLTCSDLFLEGPCWFLVISTSFLVAENALCQHL